MIQRLSVILLGSVLLAMMVAIPSRACVPDPPTESIAGADSTLASRVLAGVEDVNGRPTSIPQGMGGALPIGNDGQATNGPTNGAQTFGLTFTDATGTTQGTVTDNPDGSKTITPNGDATFTSGTLDNGKEGRQIAPGTGSGRTTGGTIKLKPRNPNDPDDVGPVATTDPSNGKITFEGNGEVKDATQVEVNGGVAIIPGSPVIHVGPGKTRKDSNVVYGED